MIYITLRIKIVMYSSMRLISEAIDVLLGAQIGLALLYEIKVTLNVNNSLFI